MICPAWPWTEIVICLQSRAVSQRDKFHHLVSHFFRRFPSLAVFSTNAQDKDGQKHDDPQPADLSPAEDSLFESKKRFLQAEAR